jgi:hypothetical protein
METISGLSAFARQVRMRSADYKSGVTEVAMSDNRASNGNLGAILGALIAVALAIFLLNGGEHFGKKTVNGDADLPPVETTR